MNFQQCQNIRQFENKLNGFSVLPCGQADSDIAKLTVISVATSLRKRDKKEVLSVIIKFQFYLTEILKSVIQNACILDMRGLFKSKCKTSADFNV